jgi:hypothetical protein
MTAIWVVVAVALVALFHYVLPSGTSPASFAITLAVCIGVFIFARLTRKPRA